MSIARCLHYFPVTEGRITAHQDLAGGPGARAVLIAAVTIDVAPLPEPVLPARNRIPAITGAARSVLIVATTVKGRCGEPVCRQSW